MRSVFVDGREWFDRINGNSYFSARIYVDGKEVARVPFQYGYGSAYEYAAAWALQDLGLLPDDDKGQRSLSSLVREAGADLYTGLAKTTKRECDKWGQAGKYWLVVAGRYACEKVPA